VVLNCRNCHGLPMPFPKLLQVWGNNWLRERLIGKNAVHVVGLDQRGLPGACEHW
jgi:hypothetical protein